MRALKNNDIDSAAILIRLGADVFEKNTVGQSPIDLIINNKFDPLQKILEEVSVSKAGDKDEIGTFEKSVKDRNKEQKSQVDSENHKNEKNSLTPIKKLINFFDRARVSLMSRKSTANESESKVLTSSLILANMKEKSPSEDVLTSNTNFEKITNKFSLPEENFADSVSGLVYEPKRKVLQDQSISADDTQVQSYLEQIEQINEKIKLLNAVC
jgi:hypothetical protein